MMWIFRIGSLLIVTIFGNVHYLLLRYLIVMPSCRYTRNLPLMNGVITHRHDKSPMKYMGQSSIFLFDLDKSSHYSPKKG